MDEAACSSTGMYFLVVTIIELLSYWIIELGSSNFQFMLTVYDSCRIVSKKTNKHWQFMNAVLFSVFSL